MQFLREDNECSAQTVHVRRRHARNSFFSQRGSNNIFWLNTFYVHLATKIFSQTVYQKRPSGAHDAYTTSLQRRCNVMTLHRRWGDIVLTSFARWGAYLYQVYWVQSWPKIPVIRMFHKRLSFSYLFGPIFHFTNVSNSVSEHSLGLLGIRRCRMLLY